MPLTTVPCLNELVHGSLPGHFVINAVMELIEHSSLKSNYVWQVLSSSQHSLLIRRETQSFNSSGESLGKSNLFEEFFEDWKLHLLLLHVSSEVFQCDVWPVTPQVWL